MHQSKNANKYARHVKAARDCDGDKSAHLLKHRAPSKQSTAAFRRQQFDERLTFVFRYIDIDHDNLEGHMEQLEDIELDFDEIATVLNRLGVPASVYDRAQAVLPSPNDVNEIPRIADMIWEIDTAGDGTLNWKEVKESYDRCRLDKSGYEPRSFITLIDFLLLDEDDNYFVTEDQIVELMTTRYDYEATDPVVLAMVNGPQWRNGGIVTLEEQTDDHSVANQRINYTEFVKRFGAAIRKQRQQTHAAQIITPEKLKNLQRACGKDA